MPRLAGTRTSRFQKDSRSCHRPQSTSSSLQPSAPPPQPQAPQKATMSHEAFDVESDKTKLRDPKTAGSFFQVVDRHIAEADSHTKFYGSKFGERCNPNRKRNETHETLLARARRCAPPRARWTVFTLFTTLVVIGMSVSRRGCLASHQFNATRCRAIADIVPSRRRFTSCTTRSSVRPARS